MLFRSVVASLGPVSTFTQQGTGKCEVDDASVVTNATTDALTCDAKVFPGRTLTPPWTLSQLPVQGDGLTWVSKPKPGKSSLAFEITLQAAAGDSSAVTIMSLEVSGPAHDCPKLEDLIN